LGDYNETGSVASFAVKERNVDLLTARLVLEPTLLDFGSCCSFSPFAGIVGRYQLRGEDVEGKMNNVALSFSLDDSTNSIAGLLGVRASGTSCGLLWSLRFEGTVDSASSSRFLAHLGADRNF
jgi:hypothetical protein